MRAGVPIATLLVSAVANAWSPVAPLLRGSHRLGLGATLLSARRVASHAPLATCKMSSSVKDFIDATNVGYEKVHRSFEEQFWGTKMALSNGTPLADGKGPSEYSVNELTRTKLEMVCVCLGVCAGVRECLCVCVRVPAAAFSSGSASVSAWICRTPQTPHCMHTGCVGVCCRRCTARTFVVDLADLRNSQDAALHVHRHVGI